MPANTGIRRFLPESLGIVRRAAQTARLHEIDPETYLADVLARIVSRRAKVNVVDITPESPAKLLGMRRLRIQRWRPYIQGASDRRSLAGWFSVRGPKRSAFGYHNSWFFGHHAANNRRHGTA
jgi:hypothetical protein